MPDISFTVSPNASLKVQAVGQAGTPVIVIAPAEEGRAGLAVYRLRMAISGAVQATMPGPAPGNLAWISIPPGPRWS